MNAVDFGIAVRSHVIGMIKVGLVQKRSCSEVGGLRTFGSKMVA